MDNSLTNATADRMAMGFNIDGIDDGDTIHSHNTLILSSTGVLSDFN